MWQPVLLVVALLAFAHWQFGSVRIEVSNKYADL